MNLRPWRENEKLIKALYERLQVVETDLNALRKEYDSLALMNQLKSEIATKVFTDLKPILSKELTEDIVESLLKRIVGFKQGVV
jgi:hypothetical protein